MYDVANSEVTSVEQAPAGGNPLDGIIRDDAGQGTPVKQDGDKGDKMAFKAGDKVTRTDGSGNGTVTDVTQRTIKVQWNGGKKVNNYAKKTAGNYLKHQQYKKDEPKKEEAKKEQTPEEKKQENKDTADSLYGILQLQKHLEEKIDASVDEELKEIREIAKSKQQLEVKVGDKVNVVKGKKHRQLETLITYGGLRLNTLLVGMAGTGKTFAAEQVSDALGIPFYAMSVGA